ncbi:MAG TPA: SUMF1/EgtB/PvdO family nonheme iron enzyme, partial [Aggregatilineales bacterium]|nr:SUMF1/EgtB/PvdO family nonheme iron enzyme [Aggregatilineales bacterium]
PDEQKYQKIVQAFKYDNHPCEGVTWYMATAFCRWLTYHWNVAQLPIAVWDLYAKSYQEKKYQPLKILLPSEAEYEKMARWTDGRMLPYGNADIESSFGFDPDKANTDESGIGMTTAVGLFPDGASPYGVLDVIGNVATWTRSQSRGYPYKSDDGREDEQGKAPRIIRGGSWKGDSSYAYASCRGDGINPTSKHSWVGFFVVAYVE